jgi:hypothetical protein
MFGFHHDCLDFTGGETVGFFGRLLQPALRRPFAIHGSGGLALHGYGPEWWNWQTQET